MGYIHWILSNGLQRVPAVMRLDHESVFTSKSFQDLASAHGLELHFSGAKSHSSIGSGGTYRQPLRQVFRILRKGHLAIEPELNQQYAVKFFNDSIDANILVPSLFVFGSLSSFLVSSTALPNRNERLQMIRYAREEVAQIKAEQLVSIVWKAIFIPSAKYKIEPAIKC